jgi:pimeloyl-ACP methyl ester carboxylesterase
LKIDNLNGVQAQVIKKSHNVKINDEKISCNILSGNNLAKPPEFFFLHGAGTAGKERIESISTPIIQAGMNILAFDFSGHGESTGDIKKSSLKKRVEEATGIIDHFCGHGSITLCGASMGGYVAIRMLALYSNIDTLILFCPALYDKKAYDVRFDSGFTDIIRVPESWRNTDALSLLEKFSGNLLIVMGENDEVIPSEVIDLIMQHSKNARKKELYVIPECPHIINAWIVDKEKEKIQLEQKIAVRRQLGLPVLIRCRS